MFQGICADVLDAKWATLSELTFPVNAKKIAAADCLNEDLRQFFFAEINHYSKNILSSLTANTNLSADLATNSDGDAVANILYDWVEFSEEETYNLLRFAIDTEIFFLLSPAKCLADFLFHPNPNAEADEEQIEDIIKELEFISDKQGILGALKAELEELANIQKSITRSKFVNVANDIVFNLYQKQSIDDFLLPCKHYLEFSANENIPVDFVELFLQERDLAGVLTEIQNYASANEKQALSYEELYNEFGRLTGKLSETTEENISEAEESLPEMEEDIPADSNLAAEDNDIIGIEEIAEADAIEEVAVEAEAVSDEVIENEEIEEVSAEENVAEMEEIESTADITEEVMDLEDSAETIEEVEDIQIEEEAVEPLEEEIVEEAVGLELEDNIDITEEIAEVAELETTEEPAEELPAADVTEEVNEEERPDTAIEKEPEVIIENEEVAEVEADVPEEVETTETQTEDEGEELVSEEENIEANEAADEVVVPEDFEEFADAVEMEVDNAIAEMEAEDVIVEESITGTVVNEKPKVAPVVAPPTPAMQAVMANSSNINSKMAEMRSNYINSKISEMRALGKTLFEIEHNYLEMETEQVAKILQLLKE